MDSSGRNMNIYAFNVHRRRAVQLLFLYTVDIDKFRSCLESFVVV